MLETLIASYISTLNDEMVMNYAEKEGYLLNQKEAAIITTFLKQNWRFLLSKDTSCLEQLRPKLKEETMKKVIELYEKAKKTYLR